MHNLDKFLLTKGNTWHNAILYAMTDIIYNDSDDENNVWNQDHELDAFVYTEQDTLNVINNLM